MVNSKNSLYFILLCLAISFVVVYFVIKPFLGPLILAAIFAFLFQPLYQKFVKLLREKSSPAAFLTMMATIFLVLLPIYFLGSQIFKEAMHLYNALAGSDKNSFIGIIENIAGKTRLSFLIPEHLNLDLNQYLKQALSIMVQGIGNVFSGVTAAILDFFVFFMAYYYFLRDGHKLKDFFISLSPLDEDNNNLILSRLRTAVSSVVKGNLLIGFIQGILTGIGFSIFGVPNPMLWGAVAALAALVPSVGTALIITPAILYLFFSGDTFEAGGLLLWGVIAVGLIDNFLGPRLVGSGMRLHPLAAFLSVLGGLAFFGPLGILLGPLVLGVCLALVEIYFALKKQN